MEIEILLEEIKKLKQFLNNEITPNGILANHLNLLIFKLNSEYSSTPTITSSRNSLITLKFLMKSQNESTNTIILSNISINMTTLDLFYQIQNILNENLSLTNTHMILLKNQNILSIDNQITLEMCGICDQDILTFDTQHRIDSSSGNSKEGNSSVLSSSTGAEEIQNQTSSHPFIQKIQQSGIIPRNTLEAFALATHAVLLQNGFICVCERDSGNQKVAGFAQPLSELPRDRFVPPRWNTESEGLITFLYKHKSKPGKQFTLKCIKISETEIAINLFIKGNTPNPASGLPIQIQNFLDISVFHSGNIVFRQLYSNPLELEDYILSMVFDSFPELRTNPSAVGPPTSSQPPPSGYQDPLRSYHPPASTPSYYPPYGVGSGDLGPNIYPPGRGGEGSLVGPDHPMFQGGHGYYPPDPSLYPQPRFDPLVPFPGNPMGGRNNGRGRGRGVKRFPGEPGPDHLRPPGFNDDDDMFT